MSPVDHSGENNGDSMTSPAVEALLADGESDKKSPANEINATEATGIVDDKPTTSDSAEHPANSQPAEFTADDPSSKTTGMVVVFGKAVDSAQIGTAITLIEADLDVFHPADFGGVRILPIKGEGRVTVTTPMNCAPLPADATTHVDELVATVYRSSTNKTPQSSARPLKNSPVVAENSSLLFHRTEILKARTLRVLANTKGMVDLCGCPKRESANLYCIAPGSEHEVPSLSALIDLAKAKIHRKLSTPEHIGGCDFPDFPPPVEKGKSKKKTKKSGAAAASKKIASGVHVYKVIAVAQLCVLLFLVLCIVGMSAESKGRCVGIWMGA